MEAVNHRLNMELSPKFIWAPCAHCTHQLRPRNPPPPYPAFGLIYEGAIGQPRQATSLCDPLLSTHGSDQKCKNYYVYRKLKGPISYRLGPGICVRYLCPQLRSLASVQLSLYQGVQSPLRAIYNPNLSKCFSWSQYNTYTHTQGLQHILQCFFPEGFRRNYSAI